MQRSLIAEAQRVGLGHSMTDVRDRAMRGSCPAASNSHMAPQQPLQTMRLQLHPKLYAADAAPAETRCADIANRHTQPPRGPRYLSTAGLHFAVPGIDDCKRVNEAHRHHIGVRRAQRTGKRAAATESACRQSVVSGTLRPFCLRTIASAISSDCS